MHVLVHCSIQVTSMSLSYAGQCPFMTDDTVNKQVLDRTVQDRTGGGCTCIYIHLCT